MQRRKKRPIFFDLDETLIYAAERSEVTGKEPYERERIFDYDVMLRPEAPQLLEVARSGGREVYLFTHSNFGYAVEVSRRMGLGFDEATIFSFSMILNCRRGLCPEAVLIENKPHTQEDTQVKMEALGIPPEQVWLLPSFEPPKFASAKLFLAGLKWRLTRLDRGGAEAHAEGIKRKI